MSRRLLPEVAAAAVPGAVLVSRPAGTVRHVACTRGLTRQGRLRRAERPLCGRAGRGSWPTQVGAGRPLCQACETRVRNTAGPDQLTAAARTLTPLVLADVLAAATTLDQVEAVAGLVITGGPTVMRTVVPLPGPYRRTVPLQAAVASARTRVAPAPHPFAGRPAPRLYRRESRWSA